MRFNFQDSRPGGRERRQQANEKVSMLVNSIYYFLECAFILDHGDQFRLVVLHRRRLLVYDSYRTARGARIAFSKIFSSKAWKRDTKAEWSHFYNPEVRWLKDKVEGVEMSLSTL